MKRKLIFVVCVALFFFCAPPVITLIIGAIELSRASAPQSFIAYDNPVAIQSRGVHPPPVAEIYTGKYSVATRCIYNPTGNHLIAEPTTTREFGIRVKCYAHGVEDDYSSIKCVFPFNNVDELWEIGVKWDKLAKGVKK